MHIITDQTQPSSCTTSNQQTTVDNTATLISDELLSKAAQMKADDMALNGYFAHTNAEKQSVFSWLNAVGYKYKFAAENISLKFTDSDQAVNSWIRSPSYRLNLLFPHFKQIGTGIAKGHYKGREVTFVVQFLADPL